MTSVQIKIPDQPIDVPRQIHTYAELQQQIHEELRIQHPEWSSQMANPPCASWNCSTLRREGDPTSLSLFLSAPSNRELEGKDL